MASSEVEIANSALIKIGEDTISSLDDPIKAARRCKRQYPLKRDQLLEDYNWTFAIARASLAPDGTAPAFGFEARFLLPHDSLRFLGLFDENQAVHQYTATKVAHKIEGRYLLLSDTVANIFYIQKVTNPHQFSPQFTEALATLLAIDLAYDLTSGTKRVAQLENQFNGMIRRARFVQAIQGLPETIVSSEWLDARDQGFRGPFNIGPVEGW